MRRASVELPFGTFNYLCVSETFISTKRYQELQGGPESRELNGDHLLWILLRACRSDDTLVSS
jgi:hypothetical protein